MYFAKQKKFAESGTEGHELIINAHGEEYLGEKLAKCKCKIGFASDPGASAFNDECVRLQEDLEADRISVVVRKEVEPKDPPDYKLYPESKEAMYGKVKGAFNSSVLMKNTDPNIARKFLEVTFMVAPELKPDKVFEKGAESVALSEIVERFEKEFGKVALVTCLFCRNRDEVVIPIKE
mmetsp:Transcript_98689/g.235108  ORF Transcript_98689/g.235108 Transcript_98689/m.235108 type:complete len:179 (-) Transcript_98689:91-627(-)